MQKLTERTTSHRGITIIWSEAKSKWYFHLGDKVGGGRFISSLDDVKKMIDFYFDND